MLGHNMTAPAWLVNCQVVAVVRLQSFPGEHPFKIVAITREGDSFHAHYASSRDGQVWEPYHGVYGVSWQQAWQVVADRVERNGLA